MKSKLFALCALVFSANSYGQLAVIDGANLSNNVRQVVESVKQYDQMLKDYAQMIKEYDQLVKEYNAIIGSRGMSLLENTTFEKDFIRRYMPSDFQMAVDLRYGANGRPGTNRFGTLLRDIVGKYDLPEASPAFQGSRSTNGTYKAIYDDRLRSSQAVLAAAQTSQFHLESRLTAIESLLRASEGGGTSNDLKKSVDLNTRMVAENAFLQAEIIRMLSQQNTIAGLENQEDLARQASRQKLIKYGSR